MLVLCKLKGDGSEKDHYRVNFPTFQMIAYDSNSELAVVDIPDLDVPENVPAPPFNAPWFPEGPLPVVRGVGANLSRWSQVIRERYREGFSQWDAQEELG